MAVNPEGVSELMTKRDDASLGAPLIPSVPLNLLPESHLSSALHAAYNPEHPFLVFRHDPIFSLWSDVVWNGTFNSSIIRDFVGTATSYEFDCADRARYRFFQLSRRIPCAKQDVLADTQDLGHVIGDFPIIDEEYFEWLATLRAASRAAAGARGLGSSSRPYVVVKFGARYGTWAIRSANAYRRLQPGMPVHLLAVEANHTGFGWLHEHAAWNNFSSTEFTFLKGAMTNFKGEMTFNASEPSSPPAESVPTFTVPELLQPFDIVDIMHVDIHGSESCFYDLDVMAAVNRSVLAIHFATHSNDLHTQLMATFVEMGWIVVENLSYNGGKEPGRIYHTPYGDVRILWDGVLTVENSHLRHLRRGS